MSAQAWTPRRAAALSRRRIKTIKAAVDKHLSDIALAWADEDSFLEHEADDLIAEILRRLDMLEASITESVNQIIARDREGTA